MLKSSTLFLASLLLLQTLSFADDWPTYQHDNLRSGKSAESLELPLSVVWQRKVSQPMPAWPAPAKQDYWNRKTNLQPRIVHDRANAVVVADGRLFIGSTSDDQVRAFDTQTGDPLWTSFAEAPIRLAPTVWNNLVIYAADDGSVYAAHAKTGQLQWKTRAPEIGTRRIPGNGRIISERPIRSGVMINEEGTGYFAAGIFPNQGAYFYSIDVRNGKLLDQAPIDKSVQGYLEIRDGRVFAPTGRDPKGATLHDAKEKHGPSNKHTKLATNVYSKISDAKRDYEGRENKIVAVEAGNEVWSADVEGRVYSMAIADGRLFVSTDSGMLYAFTSEKSVPANLATGQREELLTPSPTFTLPANQRGGYVLFINPTEDQFDKAIDWAKQSTMQVVIAVDDAARADTLRNRLSAANCYGKAVVHIDEATARLVYAKNVFQRIYGGESQRLVDSLAPYGGRGEFNDASVDKPALSDTTDWTHTYGGPGNRASTKAKVGGAKLKLQWFGGPGPRNMVDRHMRTMPPLVSHGRMYVPGLDRVMAVDAFTGITLWEQAIPGSTRIGILKDCGWMAAIDNRLFVAVDDELLCVQKTDDRVLKSVAYRVPVADRHWGYVACVGSQIIGSSTLEGAARRTINRDAILEGAYSDNRPVVCSDALFAFDDFVPNEEVGGSKSDGANKTESNKSSSKPKWHYQSNGAILNPTIAATDTTVFFVENEMGDLSATQTGRVTLEEFLRHRAKLTAIDLKTGEWVWSVDLPAIEQAQNAFILCDKDHVVLVNSRNAATVHYDVRVFHPQDGKQLWSATQDNRKRLGGDHGEQDKHPVLIGDRLIVEPLAYDLDTGHKLTEFNLNKRGYGCGTISASADALFFRSGNPASYSLKTNSIDLVTSVSRPSCWINMIPANGLLLIPEGSSGCTCNFAIQTSMAFTPE